MTLRRPAPTSVTLRIHSATSTLVATKRQLTLKKTPIPMDPRSLPTALPRPARTARLIRSLILLTTPRVKGSRKPTTRRAIEKRAHRRSHGLSQPRPLTTVPRSPPTRNAVHSTRSQAAPLNPTLPPTRATQPRRRMLSHSTEPHRRTRRMRLVTHRLQPPTHVMTRV